eukprot:NODE_3591_length_939_cov_33.451970_g3439_i0.p1 GENE.NODE_3591_length_939_cov_33.451970_g3439_i0~~NODE_3591_length_939_cov_33.451970_g3439_i0.p1  ORF type:complete len:277 (+),score=82.73 NODE_3591_length_939_cov_33.451970_g3439_i0:74-832(+)
MAPKRKAVQPPTAAKRSKANCNSSKANAQLFAVEDVDTSFGAKVVEQGREYHEQGKIDKDSIQLLEADSTLLVSAKCAGSQEDTYAVKVTLQKGTLKKKWCACRVGRFGSCKHLAALMFCLASNDPTSFQTKKRTESAQPHSAAQEAQLKRQVTAKKKETNLMSMAQLKHMLRANRQLLSGVKAELAARVADQMVRGALPRCPECFGGSLRFEKGQYFCKGFFDDDLFVPCSFTAKHVDRLPWVTPADEEGE